MRGNSTFGIDKLFKWSILIISYISVLCDIFKYIFNKQTNNKYTTKSLVLDIRYFTN